MPGRGGRAGRDTALFLAHLDDLRSRLRRYKKIHVICDNASCHTDDDVAVYVEHRERIDLHFLPSYSPDCNPIERVWWNLHDQIAATIECSRWSYMDLTFTWLRPEPVQGGGPLRPINNNAGAFRRVGGVVKFPSEGHNPFVAGVASLNGATRKTRKRGAIGPAYGLLPVLRVPSLPGLLRGGRADLTVEPRVVQEQVGVRI